MNSLLVKIRAVALATLLLAPAPAMAHAQAQAPAQPAATAQPADLGALFDASSRSPEAIAKGTARLEAMRKTYRDAPSIVDKVTIHVESPNGNRDDNFEVRVGKGTDAQLRLNGATVTALDGNVTLIPTYPADKAVVIPLEKDIDATIGKLMPGIAPIPDFMLRYRDAITPSDLALGAFTGATIVGYREADGRAQFLLRGDGDAQAVVSVDAATNLVQGAGMQFVPPGAPPGFSVALQLKYDTTIAPELPEPITADVGTRTIVKSVNDLRPKVVGVGEPAPDWTLKRTDGTEVKLSSLRGSVVVIDFWATWCAPCKLSLPYLEQFARWAVNGGKNVKVFGINSLETGDATMRAKNATQYWTDQGFTMPLLLDLDDHVFDSYRASGLPTTFVIGPTGLVAAIHEAIDPRNPGAVAEELTREVTRLLETPAQR